ncbi:MAG: hypothetical protein ACLFSE_09330 [Spirochaetia bacterium]
MRNNTIGLLPLYLDLYDKITPGGHEEYRGYIDSIASLLSSFGVDVVSPGVVFTPEHLSKAEKIFREKNVIALAVLHLCYSPSLLVADFIEESRLPALIIDSTPDSTLDPNSEGILRRNHAIHGVMDLTSVLKSRGLHRVVVAGHRDAPRFRNRLEKAVKSLKAAGAFHNQKIGITGHPFEGMGDFSIDFKTLEQDFGITVQEIPVSQIAERGNSAGEEAVRQRIEEDKKFWNVDAISDEDHTRAVKDYLGLKSIVESEKLTGYTMNFQHIGESIPAPFYGCSGLISSGYGYGGEGDVLTAALGGPMNLLSHAAKFDEFFCPDWKNNRILMSHMGESDSRFVKKDSTPKLVTREGFLNPHQSVIYRFQAEPGEATFVNIAPVAAGGYRLVAGLLNIVDTELMPNIPSPHYQVEPNMPLHLFLERYAEAGGGHHLYIVRGDVLEELQFFCRYLGIEWISVSPDTKG